MSKKKKEKVSVAEEEVIQKDPQSETVSQEDTSNTNVELEAALEKEKDRYLRLFADFENYKKRTGKERLELFKTASQDVMVALLPVMDDFERALKELEKNEEDSVFEGVKLISNKFREVLRQKGLDEVETKVGENFDSEIHEAVTHIPAPSEEMKGKIIDVIEKGYRLGERIIRYPKVVIGK